MDNIEDFVENEEIIADSEDELEELGSSNNAAGRGSAVSMPPPRQRPEPSAITAFSSIIAGHGHDSSISAFTPGLPVSGTRLDERSFGKDADTSGYTNVFNDTLTGTLSIADRAKTRKRKPIDVLELTSDEDELSLRPKSSKDRSKSPKNTSKPPPNQLSGGNIDQQRPSESSGSKPRPRPRPIAKKPRTQNAAYLQATGDENPQPMPLGGPELPIATSPIRGNISDLPPSSMSLADIETLNATVDDLFDGPLSSPGSLFDEDDHVSKPKKNMKKQKRKSYPTHAEMEVDELASSPRLPPFYPDDGPVTGLPPPTFFAGSSQPKEHSGPRLAEPQSKASTSSNAAATTDTDVIDLTDLPATLAPAIIVKKPAKPKKSRKKLSEEDFGAWEETGAAGQYVFDDDNDGDFDPSGDRTGKKKAKGKTKEKGKEKSTKATKAKGKGKQKDQDTTDDIPPQIPQNVNPEQDQDPSAFQLQVGIPEVVITTKPARKSRKTKNKGNSDAPGTSSSNKEVFKSSEFINDSGEDAPGPAFQTTNGEGQGSSAHSNFDTPEEAPIPVDMPDSSKRASSGKKQKSTVVLSEEDEDEFVVKRVVAKKGKKKAAVNLDESAEEWEKLDNGGISQHEEPIRPPEPKGNVKEGKKKKRSSKKGKQDDAAKNTTGEADEATRNDGSLAQEDSLLAEEENEEDIVTSKAAKKASRKKVIYDDEDVLEEDQALDEEPPEIISSTKKNRAPETPRLVTPHQRPIAATSSSTSAAGALYARYEIAPRTRGPSMSELIRRASHPSSPFSNATSSDSNISSAGGKLKSRTSLTPSSRVYSPYIKSSRSLLNKIAPLHPNRRTPPPPPPPLPPKKKTKKELEREEKWEEELIDSIGGLEAWAALGDDERKDMRRAKFAMEMGGWDD